jgi:hypothetical protein
MSRRLLLAAAAAACLVSFGARAQNAQFHAALTGASEVPPVQTQGAGTVEATLDPSSHTLTYTLTYQNLSGPPTAAHFHGPADPGKNAGVEAPIPSAGTSPVKGTAKLTPQQEKDLQGGKVYVNVHTQAHPGGELRGQLQPGAM